MVGINTSEFDFEQLKILTDDWKTCLHQLGGRSKFQVWLRKNWERCAGTTDSNFYWQRKKSRIMNTLRPCVQIWVRLGSPSRWIGPSTREYLQAPNVFVWYIGNGFVCWPSWEFLFMNLFKTITFARDCCCWYTLFVTGCTHCIEKWKN